ncbi:MAG: phosphate ABC transporter permease PstA [Nitrospinaceae bacterium]
MTRHLLESVAVGILFLLTFTGILILVAVLGTVIVKGAPTVSGDFLWEASRDFGSGGGIFYQVMGTWLLMTGAVVVSLPLALGTALLLSEYLKSRRLKKMFRNLIYSLNGVPTILFGLAGYVFFGEFLGTGVSWLTGSLILAVMIFPTLQVSIQEAIEALPEKYRETGLAMGLTPAAMIWSIVLPQSIFGMVTGILLGLARAAGETAAIMFTATAFSGILLPGTWTDPVPTLQTHILVLVQEAVNPRALSNAWGAALVLLCLVFLLIGAALLVRGRLRMEFER